MSAKTWLSICKGAVDSVNHTDRVVHIKNKESISHWHLAFWQNNQAFPNPHVYSKDGKKTSLSPLDHNPELARCITLLAELL
jgi:hypothetical protein